MKDKLNVVVSRYFKNPKLKVVSEHTGEVNKVLILEIDDKEYALRSRLKKEDKGDLDFEYEFLDELNKQDLKVKIPRVLKALDGNNYVEEGDKVYTLLTKVSGKKIFSNWYDSQLYTDKHITSGFKILAKLHNACKKIKVFDYKRSKDEIFLLTEFENNVINLDSCPEGKFKDALFEHKDFILKKIKETKEKLKGKNYQDIPRYPVHYDLNFTNVLWKKDEIVSILDFDWAQYSTLEFDFCQMCKLSCGLFSINSQSNEFLKERLNLALETYNKYASKPFRDIELLKVLLDVSSLFLLNWSIEFFKNDIKNEGYFLNFFFTGLDRIKQERKF